MSFPTSPTNGQLAVINGITYQWSSTYNSWTRIAAQVTATNSLNVISNTSATSTITGALVVAGGVGIGCSVYIANTSYIAGAQIITTATVGNYAASLANTSTYSSYSTTASAVTVVPAVGLNSYYLTLASTTSGVLSLVTDAGGKLIYNPGSGQLLIAAGAQSTSTTTGALVVQGGIGVDVLCAPAAINNCPEPGL